MLLDRATSTIQNIVGIATIGTVGVGSTIIEHDILYRRIETSIKEGDEDITEKTSQHLIGLESVTAEKSRG